MCVAKNKSFKYDIEIFMRFVTKKQIHVNLYCELWTWGAEITTVKWDERIKILGGEEMTGRRGERKGWTDKHDWGAGVWGRIKGKMWSLWAGNQRWKHINQTSVRRTDTLRADVLKSWIPDAESSLSLTADWSSKAAGYSHCSSYNQHFSICFDLKDKESVLGLNVDIRQLQ